MKKIYVLLLVVILATTAMVSIVSAADTVKIAYLTPSLDVPFWRCVKFGVKMR